MALQACDPAKKDKEAAMQKQQEFTAAANGSWVFATMVYKLCSSCPEQNAKQDLSTVRIYIEYPSVKFIDQAAPNAPEELLNEGTLTYTYRSIPLTAYEDENNTSLVYRHCLHFSLSKPYFKNHPLPQYWIFESVSAEMLKASEEQLPYSAIVLLKP